ncbi:MAG: sigma-70 family RNA polymerase sigma factor [Deltaproteobacteria bacterium]|nr:sigma-70 family RNA polymerase sigma factor [Deltaproteobacteria bacterium]
MTENEINQMILRHSAGAIGGFAELYGQYNGLVRSVLYKLCASGDLDDLVQEAFVRIWKGLPGFQGGAQLKSWIYRVTYNLAIDHFRKKKRGPTEVELDEQGAPSTNGESSSVDKEMVHQGLKELNDEHRSVLVFHCMEGLTVAEVADVLKIPEGTVKSRLHHAKNKMAVILKGRNYDI